MFRDYFYLWVSQLIIISILCIRISDGENVLFYIGPFSSHSHRSGLEPLANKLAEKGHNVTFFGPLRTSTKHPHITDFCPTEVRSAHEGFLTEFGVIGLESRIKSKFNLDLAKGNSLFDGGLAMCEVTLRSPEFQEWVRKSSFDLIVIDKSSLSDCAYALSYVFQAKVISYSGIGCMVAWDSYLYGLPTETSWIPAFDTHYETKEMGFFERVNSELSFFSWYYRFYNYYLPRVEALVREHLNVEGMPPMEQVIMSEQIILWNTHYSDQFPRSLPPFVIPVGGMHLTEPAGQLNTELTEFIDGAGENGFMYISFGSIVSISSMPPALLQVFFDSLKSFKMRFLWKWEGELPKDCPENVMLLPWFPQKLILAHSKIRGFITQGGQVSMQQAIYSGVPLIIFPVNGDQDYNAKRLRIVGNGIELEFFGLTREDLKNSISKLVQDSSFNLAAKRLSIASRDRPLTAVETALWWTEFVLRQDPSVTQLLKPYCKSQPWWQKKSLDVWGFLFLCILAFAISSLAISILILAKLLRFLLGLTGTSKMALKKD